MYEQISSHSLKRGERVTRLVKTFLPRWFKAKFTEEVSKDIAVIQASGLFDEAYYLTHYGAELTRGKTPLQHYCMLGWQEGKNPSPDFDTRFYLETYPDIREAGINPFAHYITGGAAEDREPNPRARQEKIHQKIQGEVDIIRASGMFDEEFYRSMYPEAASEFADPIYHYCALGWREGKDPCDEFETDFYRKTQPDIVENDLNPFLHYVQAGLRECRQPSSLYKLAAQKDVWFGTVNTDIKLLALYVTPDWSRLWEGRPALIEDMQAPFPLEEQGLYEPTQPDVLRHQANLARRHGLHGFCFEISPFELAAERPTPLTTFRRAPEIQFHFCVQLACEQGLPDSQQIEVLADVMRDSRYVRVEDRPVLVLLLAANQLEPSAEPLVSDLGRALQRCGLPRPYSIVRAAGGEPVRPDAVTGMDARLDLPDQPLPEETGAYVQVQKNGVQLVPYQVVASQGVHRARQAAQASGSLPTFPGLTLRRHGLHPSLNEPLVYSRLKLPDLRRWLQAAMDAVRQQQPEDRRFIFINSWNNWNQGQTLEPDRQYGCSCLNEITQTLLALDLDPFLPKVSVVVPNYNHSKYLKSRLDSIYQQTYRNLEVILLDDCSTDSSREILEAFAAANPEITRTLYNECNSGGVFKQWAKGLEAASGELVWIAESDDYCELNFLEVLVRYFQDEAILLAYAKSVFVDLDGTPLANGFRYHLIDLPCSNRWLDSYVETAHHEVNLALGIKNTIPNASSVVFRRPPEMPLLKDPVWLACRVAGDWVFYLHLICGGKVAFSTKTHNYFRRHPSSTANLSFSQEYYYREVGFANETVARLFNVPEEVHAKSMQSFLNVYRHHCKRSDDEFIEWFGYNRVLAARQARLPNILVATMGFYPGGAEILPIRLANEFKRRGLVVALLSLGLHVRVQEVRELLRNDIPVLETSSLEETQEWIKSYGIEALNSHQWFVQRYPFVWPSVFEDLVVHVASLHGMIEHGNDAKVTREELLAADQNVTTWVYTADKNLGPFVDHDILENSRARFVKLPNGMEPPLIQPVLREDIGMPADAFVLCCVSRAIPEKGWPEAIEVVTRARELSGRDIRLILVGNGELYEEYCRQGAPAYVYLAGFNKNSVGFYAAADMGIMLTRFRSESFPLTIVDALFAGKPYLATDVGEIRNMLTLDHQIAGAVIPLCEWEVPIDLVTSALLKFVEDKDYYQQNKQLACSLAHHYRIDNVADQYIEIFREDARSSLARTSLTGAEGAS